MQTLFNLDVAWCFWEKRISIYTYWNNTITEEFCGGIFEAESSGDIRVPTHGSNYSPNLNCRWEIQAGPDQMVALVSTEWAVEESPGCTWVRLIKSTYQGNFYTRDYIYTRYTNAVKQIAYLKICFKAQRNKTKCRIVRSFTLWFVGRLPQTFACVFHPL